MKQKEDEIQAIMEQLSILEPTPADAPRPVAQSLARVRQRIQRKQDNSLLSRLSRLFTMSSRRIAFATLLFTILFGLAFTFPAVRAAASDFLGLFRIQKFAAISISSEQLAILNRVAEEGAQPGVFEIFKEPGDLTLVRSLAEASSMTGMAPRSLPSLGAPETIFVTSGGNGRLTIDLAGSRAIMEATGVDPALLSDSLDGKQVEVEIFDGVEQHWANGTILLQTESPQVEYPEGLDPVLLGQALLQVLGMNEIEATRLAQNIDWTSTLLLPIPQDFAKFSEVTIEGESSLALTSLDGDHSLLMWQKEGIIYLLNGPGNTADLVPLANSVK